MLRVILSLRKPRELVKGSCARPVACLGKDLCPRGGTGAGGGPTGVG